MMHHILAVEPQEDFLLRLTFQDGEERVFDLKPYLRGALFRPLTDEALFKQVRPSKRPRGVVWPNGADLCADMLYLNSRPQERDRSNAVSRDPAQEVETDLPAR
jgi:hypothetical protein